MRKKEILMAVVLALGVLLRLAGLGAQSVWSGECLTTALSSGQNLIFVFFNSIENGAHPPLFYMLEHMVISIFGVSEFSIRLLPALLGILCIFIFYRLVRSFFSEKVTAIAVLLFCLNPLMIYYSREAGPYSLYLAVSMLIVYYFLMSIKYNSFLAGPFILWSIIGLYSHENTMLLLLTLNFMIFVTNRKDIRLVPWAIAQGIIIAAWLPLMLLSIKPAAVYAPSAGITWLEPLYSMKNFLTGPAMPVNWVAIAAVAVCLIFAVLGVISRRKANEKRVLDAAAIMIFAVMAIQWIISFIRPGSYDDKNMLIAAALIILVLSVGVSYMSDQGLAAFLVLITAVYSASSFNYFFTPKYAKTPYRELFKKISTSAVQGSLIIHTGRDSYSAFEFYNSYAKKTGYLNRLRGDSLPFSGKGNRLSIYNMRKNFRENINKTFNFAMESGTDKYLLGQQELKAVIGGYRRAFLVMDGPQAMKQPYLPRADMWNSGLKFEAPPAPETVWWVREYFNIKETISAAGCDVYLLEKK
jgi:4-amino-4-deoxy-L-arabinose transferase-like glycosyltransferase